MLILGGAAGAGTLALGARGCLAVRGTVGLALCAQAFFLLALAGWLRPAAFVALALIALCGWLRQDWSRKEMPLRLSLARAAVWLFVALPLFVLALYPSIAFDETLYHLPFVQALAESGRMQVLSDLRFPVFPQLHELLTVPSFLLAGETGAHLVSTAEVLLAAGLLMEWGRESGAHRGSLAAALFLGSPLVLFSGAVLYVEAALVLFVTGGFYCLERARREGGRPVTVWVVCSGLLLGTACSVKYLGGFFALAGLILVCLLPQPRLRRAMWYVATGAAAALPTTLWLVFTTGNPFFPFLTRVFGENAWSHVMPEAGPAAERIWRTLRVVWDVTFARERMGFQAPVTPFLALMVLLLFMAARTEVRARGVLLLSALYLVIFSFLPQDPRYLLSLLPLLSLVTAESVTRILERRGAAHLVRWLVVVAILPGAAYAVYRVTLQGLPPVGTTARQSWLSRQVPEYPALQRAGSEAVYVCGAEQVKGLAGGRLLGDVVGPYSNALILGDDGIAADDLARLRSLQMGFLLIAKRVCGALPAGQAPEGLELVFEDGAAQLWAVRGAQAHVDASARFAPRH